ATGHYSLTFKLYQLHNNPGHSLGDFSLGYATDRSPILTSTETLFTVTGATSQNGTTFTFPSLGQIITTGTVPATDVYTITVDVNSAVPITGIFLNAINDPNNGFPTGGPGRYANGNFHIVEFTASASQLGPDVTYDVVHGFNTTGVQPGSGNPFTYGTETSLNVGFTLLPRFFNTNIAGSGEVATGGTLNDYYFAQNWQLDGPTIEEIATGNTVTIPS